MYSKSKNIFLYRNLTIYLQTTEMIVPIVDHRKLLTEDYPQNHCYQKSGGKVYMSTKMRKTIVKRLRKKG